MRCEQCGAEVDATGKTCPECGHSVGMVEILTPEEREGFQGLTIETPGSGGARQDDYSYEYHEPQTGVDVRKFNFNTGHGNLLNRILVGLVIAGVFFLALPILFLIFPMLFVILGAVLLGGFIAVALRRR
jgi:RNA polymerase subunit RPABC4/transcription elongation factor Spt4